MVNSWESKIVRETQFTAAPHQCDRGMMYGFLSLESYSPSSSSIFFVLRQTDLLRSLGDKRKWKDTRICVANVRRGENWENESERRGGRQRGLSESQCIFLWFPMGCDGRPRRSYPPRSRRDIARVDEKEVDILATRVSSRSMIYFIALRERPA